MRILYNIYSYYIIISSYHHIDATAFSKFARLELKFHKYADAADIGIFTCFYFQILYVAAAKVKYLQYVTYCPSMYINSSAIETRH